MNNYFFLVLDITLKGGIERFVCNFAELISDEQNIVKIFSFHKSNDEIFYRLPVNIEIIFVTNFNFSKYTYKITTIIGCFRLINYKFNYKNSFFISTSPIISIYLVSISRNISKRLIASEHSSYKSSTFFIRHLRAFCYRFILSIFTQTNDGVKDFKSDGLTAYCIPNPVTYFGDKYQWNLNQCRDNKIYPSIFTVITVARLDRVKQLDHFIKICKYVSSRIPQVHFKIIGDGPEKSILADLIIQLKLTDVIEIIPATKDVSKYYSNASAYIICSKSEAFPMAMLEALSYGLPVFSYNNLIGPREVLVDSKNGFLVQKDDIIGMSNALIKFYNDKNNHIDMNKCAIDSVRIYSPESIKKLFLNMINLLNK